MLDRASIRLVGCTDYSRRHSDSFLVSYCTENTRIRISLYLSLCCCVSTDHYRRPNRPEKHKKLCEYASRGSWKISLPIGEGFYDDANLKLLPGGDRNGEFIFHPFLFFLSAQVFFPLHVGFPWLDASFLILSLPVFFCGRLAFFFIPNLQCRLVRLDTVSVYCAQKYKFVFLGYGTVLRIRDILVRKFFCLFLFEGSHTSVFKDKKSQRRHKTVGIKVFLTIFAWW